MRRTAAAVLGAVVVALPYGGAAAAATKPKTVKKVVSKSYAGPAAEADRWGTVQVTVVYRTTTLTTGKKKTVTRRITDVKATYSYHTDRSQFIMSQALPLLRQEVLTAQSANVQMISHATDTSDAFLQSLQAAVSQIVQ
jgi:uncharacterized protein with FMN-binding domain